MIASELEDDRAKVIKGRFSDKKNLQVIQSNLMELDSNQVKYDILSVIGVLEYSGKYVKTKRPYLDFLKKTHSLLSKNGTLILAIENKLGLKYLTGCTEDHSGKYFESLNNYPEDKGIRTFSKAELSSLLTEAGYKSMTFYYPYPDYKLPTHVVSDEFLSDRQDFLNPHQFFNSPDYYRKKTVLIDEATLGAEFFKNNILSSFSNSFLVIASP